MSFKLKTIVFILFYLFFSTIYTNSSYAIEQNEYSKAVLFINQVRGNECCDPGSVYNLEKQINGFKDFDIKANFALRYDVLKDTNFLYILNQLDQSQFELGAFLEITPNLANDAGVEYLGSNDSWYKAQNAYTVGYSFEDRKKLIDQYMSVFFERFDYYPNFSTAWIMDTNSVNYLKNEYGVKVHQITREQWGTDSYTLSGGSIHYPYIASDNWIFARGLDEGNQSIILRQTGADPLFNYGDTTNSFTTQPNDYALGNRNTVYFNKLKDQFLDQRHNNYGFLLLGLENSMADIHQTEFLNQIESTSNDIETETFTINEFIPFFNKNNQPINGLEGKDLVNGSGIKSFWISTDNYRLRIIYKDNSLFISDLRLVNEDLNDPYNEYVAKDLAFWVMPYILNASQHYLVDEPESVKSLSYRKNFKDKFLHELRLKVLPEFKRKNFEVNSSSNDTNKYFDGLILSEKIDSVSELIRLDSGDLKLNFTNSNSMLNTLTFKQSSFITDFKIYSDNLILEQSDFLEVHESGDDFNVSYSVDNSAQKGISVNCNDNDCEINFSQPSDELFKKLREDLYPYFFPEIKNRLLNNQESVFYAHNKYSIASKNPVRFVFIPRDEKGFATTYENFPVINIDKKIDSVDIHEKQGNGTTFIDIHSSKAGKYNVTFSLDGLVDKNETIYFSSDCKIDIIDCLLHPNELLWYLSSMFYTKLRNF